MLGDDDIIFSHMHAYAFAWMEVQVYAPFKKIKIAVFFKMKIIKTGNNLVSHDFKTADIISLQFKDFEADHLLFGMYSYLISIINNYIVEIYL